MATLDSFLVSIGVKGQDVVLNTINNIKKEGKNLSKINPSLNFGNANIQKALSSTKRNITTNAIKAANPQTKGEDTLDKDLRKILIQDKKMPKEQEKLDQDLKKIIQNENDGIKKTTKSNNENNEQFSKSSEKMGEGAKKLTDSVKPFTGAVNTFAGSAESLNPVSTLQGIAKAGAEIAGGWSIIGFSAGKTVEGAADLANSGISMSAGTIGTAKQSTEANYNLIKRKTAMRYYGGNIDENNRGALSRNELSNVIGTVSGSYGKIQAPLAEEITKLITSGRKDTGAVARVSAGNWQSTGTDKGWFLQQIADQFQGLPPSVAQKFQTQLLKSNSAEIQNATPEQTSVQQTQAGFEATGEKQVSDLYAIATSQLKDITGLNDKFNTLQRDLVTAGTTMVKVLDITANAMQKAISKIQTQGGK